MSDKTTLAWLKQYKKHRTDEVAAKKTLGQLSQAFIEADKRVTSILLKSDRGRK